MGEFTGLSVLLLASNERELLRRTIDGAADACGADLKEIVILLLSPDCPAAAECGAIGDTWKGVPLRCVVQRKKGVLNAVAELVFAARTSHFVLMSSDLEMDPRTLARLLPVARAHPDAIVCASKWQSGSVIRGYSLFYRIANRTVNSLAARLVGSDGRDLFTVYQIYPLSLFEAMGFSPDDRLVFEYTLRPVCRGAEYIELPTVFRRRPQRRSRSSLRLLVTLFFRFLAAAVRLRAERRRLSPEA